TFIQCRIRVEESNLGTSIEDKIQALCCSNVLNGFGHAILNRLNKAYPLFEEVSFKSEPLALQFFNLLLLVNNFIFSTSAHVFVQQHLIVLISLVKFLNFSVLFIDFLLPFCREVVQLLLRRNIFRDMF